MKKWQEERNYRRVRSEGGEVIANIITVDGMDVEVPEDVYLAYAQADRRERYITEEQSSGKLLSLEQMEEDALLPDYVGAETAPSAETEALEREELRNLAEQKQIILLALLSLKVLTAKISAFPSLETACTLSDILMSDVEEKYFLSPKQQEVLLFKPTVATKGSASTPPKD